LEKGVAFPFIRRFLNINKSYPERLPVEVVLLSRNDPDTGQRVFNSIKHYGLDISRAGFLSGKSPYKYIPAFNVSLFLSANEDDVRKAIEAGHPAGTVLPSEVTDDIDDSELRVAFDFDGVIADDESEAVYYDNEDVDEFQEHEQEKAHIPHNPGPLNDLFKKLSINSTLRKIVSGKRYFSAKTPSSISLLSINFSSNFHIKLSYSYQQHSSIGSEFQTLP